jgi:hypothetical protein
MAPQTLINLQHPTGTAMNTRHTLALLAFATSASAALATDPLFTNGPIITQPTGGTGAIAGLPLSNADGFNVPGSTFLFSTTGTSASISDGTSVAENFTVPAGLAGWRIDAARFFAFQTSQTTATVTTVRVNLWTATPFSAGSPAPVPDPLPTPILTTPLQLSTGPGAFVCHRQSPSSTSTVRPVFSYTVPITGLFSSLPNGGVLPPGTYWLEWTFQGAATPSPRVFIPLVSPRTAAFDTNARLFNSIDGSAAGPRIWFEGREGFVAGSADGRPYALAFELLGTALPCPADFDQSGGTPDAGDVDAFFTAWLAGDPTADTDYSGGTPDAADIDRFFQLWLAGGC